MGSVLSIEEQEQEQGVQSEEKEDGPAAGEKGKKDQSKSPPTIWFSNPNSPVIRQNLTIFRSFDDGQTWPQDAHTLVYSGLGGYSCLTRVPGGDRRKMLGLLWETGAENDCIGSACRIVFSLFDQ